MPTPQEIAAMLQQARPAMPAAPVAGMPSPITSAQAGALTDAQKEMERRAGLRASAKAAFGLTDEQYDQMLAGINAQRK